MHAFNRWMCLLVFTTKLIKTVIIWHIIGEDIGLFSETQCVCVVYISVSHILFSCVYTIIGQSLASLAHSPYRLAAIPHIQLSLYASLHAILYACSLLWQEFMKHKKTRAYKRTFWCIHHRRGSNNKQERPAVADKPARRRDAWETFTRFM